MVFSFVPNRVIHVTEQRVLPPTITEMLKITDTYTTTYDVSMLRKFFEASGLDVKHLPRFLGADDGQLFTLLAPTSKNFELVTAEWEKRLQESLWSRHARNLVMNLVSDQLVTKLYLGEATQEEDFISIQTMGGDSYFVGSARRIDLESILGQAGCVDG